MLQQVADGVHRSTDGVVNFYIVEDDTGLTLIDSGWPDSWPRITEAIVSLDRPASDVKALLLTHSHVDHMGAAEHTRVTLDIPVHLHAHEAQLARGQAPGSSPFSLIAPLAPQVWKPKVLSFLLHGLRHGAQSVDYLSEVTVFGDDAVLDVPGRPQAVACPGHTAGHTAYHLPDRGVLFSGDALATLDMLTGARGPRLLPDVLQSDPNAARTSLSALAVLEAGIVLPGHGEPWHGSPAVAVEHARG